MPSYRVFCLRDGRLVASHSLEASSDESAVKAAKRIGSGSVIEIWRGAERVRVVRPDVKWSESAQGA